MKKMQKHRWVSFVLVTLLLLQLFGCGTPGTSDFSSFDEDMMGFSSYGTGTLPPEDVQTNTSDSTTAFVTDTTTITTVTTTVTTIATNVTTSTTTGMPTTTTTTQLAEDVSGPEYEGYRLVRDAVEKLRNKKHFSVVIKGDFSTYEGGEYVPTDEYWGDGIFSPDSPTSVKRSMNFSSTVRWGAATLFMCQHDKDVFYSHILGSDEKGKNVWSKKRFTTNSLTENFALTEASVAELRHLPSAKNAINVEILPNTKYGTNSNGRSVTISVPAAEFAQLYENSIRHFAFMILEPDSTLKYTVHDCEVTYIIDEEKRYYDMVLMYHMEVTGTKSDQPYQKSLKVFTSMLLFDYNKDTVPEHNCYLPDSAEYEKIDNPGWVYYSTLPALS